MKKEESHITEGAYVLSTISRDGIRPLEEDTYLGNNVEYAEEISIDYASGAKDDRKVWMPIRFRLSAKMS